MQNEGIIKVWGVVMIHKHWTIIGYNERKPHETIVGSFYRLNNDTQVKVDADSEEEAIKKAKAVIERKFYDTLSVEDCQIDHELHQELQLEAIATQKLMLKELKGHKEG